MFPIPARDWEEVDRDQDSGNRQNIPHSQDNTKTLTPAVGSSVPPKTPYLQDAAATCSGSQGHIGLFYFFIIIFLIPSVTWTEDLNIHIPMPCQVPARIFSF